MSDHDTPQASPARDRPAAAVAGGMPAARRTALLAVSALGIVFGDIGTSPLYTLHECTSSAHGAPPTPANILGVLSLIFWSLTTVVSLKYLVFILRADNHGEGGIFALLALLPERTGRKAPGTLGWAALLAIVGAALLYGDGMITPAISVLSAMEGLEVATPALRPAVIPLTCLVLAGLFALQHRGTARVGRLFGPVMVLWFVTIGGLGLFHVAGHPAVLAALAPVEAARFFAAHGVRGLAILGSVALAVTGGEALYADLGNFGARPIRLAWFALVMPSLVLNYFGQGALMLADPAARHHPFYAMVPAGGWTYALAALATAATIIASQALISGVFSLTHQAVQLGFFPRVAVTHTSREMEGQIYVPPINWFFAVGCVVLVLAFRRSTNLAAAYGVAVTGTMAITSVLYFEVTRSTWRWPAWRSIPLLALFLSFDLPFFGANLLKFRDGGFVPVLMATAFIALMVTWKKGRDIYRAHLASIAPSLPAFLASPACACAVRAPGAGVFVSGHADGVPPVLLNLAQRIRVLPETVVLLTVRVLHVPHAPDDAMTLTRLEGGFFRLVVDWGFMDTSHVPHALARAVERLGLPVNPAEVTYYIGRANFLATSAGRMGRWSEALFAFLARNAKPITHQFCIPPEQSVEIGSQIDL